MTDDRSLELELTDGGDQFTITAKNNNDAVREHLQFAVGGYFYYRGGTGNTAGCLEVE